MLRERSLLERLADPRPEATRTTHQNEALLVASILDHLGKMLNTRRGNAPVALDYGIPDMADMVHSFPEAIRAMEQAIRATIEKYEPRLTNIRVRHSGSGQEEVFSVHFDITATIVPTASRKSVSFRTRVDSSGEFEIRE
ncbi:MAG: type VI secretion system baseplate subunit TssE [Acidobacteriota bacterium]|jgi:type VI secretion system protein